LILNFIFIHIAPGDPAEVLAGAMGGTTEELLVDIRHRYGLDQSLATQIVTYVGQMASGNLGYSFFFNKPVSELILGRLPATVLLMFSALTLSITIGLILGLICALKPTGFFNSLISFFSLAGYAAPVFWTGLILILAFSFHWPYFPVNGMYDVVNQKSGLAYVFDVLRHMILPTTTLAILNTALFSRLTRSGMIEALNSDFIRTARAKGLHEWQVIFKHALRNALIPVVTMIGLQFGQLLAGAVVVETVFGWPGLGRLVMDSILRRDYPTLLGILFFSAALVMAANIITDFIYRIIDPRVRKTA
jgi:peptide/nickel transport system permease protein